jgi:glutamate carboxypeptidase
VLADAEQYQPEALKLLERLVNIDSGSGYEPGLKQVSEIAIDELKKLGATIELVPNTPEKPTTCWPPSKAPARRKSS